MRDVFIGFCVHDHKFSTLTSHLRKQIKSYVTGRFRIIQSAVSVFLYDDRSEEHTSELQSLMRISYAVFCLNKKITTQLITSYKHKSSKYLRDINNTTLVQP